MDILANHHSSRDFKTFWKETNKLNPRPSIPVSIDGCSDPNRVANVFREHFKVQPSGGGESGVFGNT